MAKVLVAYFSAGGVTAKVAERLAAAADGDLYEIRPEIPYTHADLNWMDKHSRSTLEMNDTDARPALADTDAPVKDADVIFVGFPVWWYREPSVIDTFLEAYDFAGKTVIPFATSGGSGLGETAKRMQGIVPDAVVQEGRRLERNISGEELKAWVRELGL